MKSVFGQMCSVEPQEGDLITHQQPEQKVSNTKYDIDEDNCLRSVSTSRGLHSHIENLFIFLVILY